MEEQCSPLSWGYCYQEEGIEELRHLYRTLELETTILSAKEEIERKEFELIHLKDVLNRTVKERNEAQTQCQSLMLEKLILQQQLHKQQQLQQQQQQEEAAALLSGTSTSEDESKPAVHDSNKHFSSSDCTKNVVLSPVLTDPIPQQPESTQQLPQAAERPLPQKGKLLKAVMEAGPLLQTLLLAGPLPQWQHPPPQLDSIEIPPVAISSPSPRLPNHHQNPFNSPTSCLSKKRGIKFSELGSNSPPNTKYQKIALH